ncbi:MAG: hypothetical protein EZS28_015961 [Streblomastix strix]|uniref:Uncharacterized protein n=1 Tax=Streblomastix strix TaxID=222440 RepID=A0A5J4W1I4_9EUKA|nr:MAG: hypothetical protein EZS28_015961 [Streblomastix strix]
MISYGVHPLTSSRFQEEPLYLRRLNSVVELSIRRRMHVVYCRGPFFHSPPSIRQILLNRQYGTPADSEVSIVIFVSGIATKILLTFRLMLIQLFQPPLINVLVFIA